MTEKPNHSPKDKLTAVEPYPRFPEPLCAPATADMTPVYYWLTLPAMLQYHELRHNGSPLKATKWHMVSQITFLSLLLSPLIPAPKGPSPITKYPYFDFAGSNGRSRLKS